MVAVEDCWQGKSEADQRKRMMEAMFLCQAQEELQSSQQFRRSEHRASYLQLDHEDTGVADAALFALLPGGTGKDGKAVLRLVFRQTPVFSVAALYSSTERENHPQKTWSLKRSVQVKVDQALAD